MDTSHTAVPAGASTPDRSSALALVRRLALSRYVLIAVFAAGLLIFLPAVRSPFLLDDYLHASMAQGTYPAARGRFDLYDFVSDADRDQLSTRGFFPWWTNPRLTIRFFRPLSSAMLWSEHHVFGRRPIYLHLVSFAWWALAVVAARSLYRRAFSTRASLFATLAFALSPCHSVPLAWLANSEVLIAIAFGTIGLGAYARWREERDPRQAVLALALFTLSMLSGEYGFAFGGYVLAIEIVRRKDKLLARASGVLPFVIPAAACLVARARLGYGTVGSGFYSDPLREPMVFLSEAPWRLVALLSNLWATYDAETTDARYGRCLVVAFMLVASVALIRTLSRAFDSLDERPRRTATWLLLGSFFALAPVLAVAPSARVIGVSTIGVAAAVGILLEYAWFPALESDRSRAAGLTGLTALFVAFAQLIHGPMNSWLLARRMEVSAVDFGAAIRTLRTHVPEPATADVTVIRGGGASFFAPFAIDTDGRPPDHWRVLSLTGHVLLLRRDERSIEIVTTPDQGLFRSDRSNLFRSPDAPLHAGDVIVNGEMRATVVAATDRGPSDVLFEFDRDLDSPSMTWISERISGFQIIELPQPGFGMPLDP